MKSINSNVILGRDVAQAMEKGHQEDGWDWSGSSPPSPAKTHGRNRERRVEYNCANCGNPCLGANKSAKFCPPPASCRTQYNRRNDPERLPVLTRAANHCERCGCYSKRLFVRDGKAICSRCNSSVSAEIAGSLGWQYQGRRSTRLCEKAVPMICIPKPKVIPFSALGMNDAGNRLSVDSTENALARRGQFVADFVDELLDSL